MNFFRHSLICPLALLAGLLRAAGPYDLIIRGAQVLDGTGLAAYPADVAVAGGRIAAVGRIPSGAAAARTIDATGLYLAPGFIDTHSHAWPALGRAKAAAAAPILTQGVTTVFVNPDGGGPTDLPLQRRLIEQQRPGINVAQFIGHNSIRIEVLGYANRAPEAAELDRMRGLVRRGMQAGAFGLSAGPFYTPGNFSKTPEHVALAKVAAEFGGVYSSHIRDESNYNVGLLAAVDEVITVAREAQVTGIVSHIKALGPEMWGKSSEVIERINAARAAGVQVFADQYPYEASSTSLSAALLPPWALEGGRGALSRRLTEAAALDKIKAAMAENLARRGGAHSIQICSEGTGERGDGGVAGQRLDVIAQRRGLSPVDAAIGLIRVSDVSIVSFNMSEADIRAFMVQPWTMTCTDGSLVLPGEGVPHPRGYGTFPRKIHRYVVEQKLLTLEQAVHSMTGLPAAVMHVQDRGLVRVGAWADLAVFDLAALRDRATYDEPTLLSEGMRYVLVNGQLAVDEGKVTAGRFGRVLSRLDSDPTPVKVVPVTAAHGMVAAGHPQAAQAGVDVLKAGGNAIDAAVAVSLALGVAEPYASGLGGKLNLIYYEAASGKTYAIDGLDQAGASIDVAAYRRLPTSAHIYGWSAVCVPGLAAGLYLAHEHWGVRPWAEDVQPAIRLAQQGFTILPKTRQLFAEREAVLRRYPEIARIYLPNGRLPEVGSVLLSPDLARTMEQFAERGPAGFYSGPVADAMIASAQRSGGFLTAADFAGYRARLTEPVSAEVFGCQIYGGPPPTDGLALYLPCLKALETEHWEPGPLRNAANLDKLGRVWRLVEPVATRTVADVPGARKAVAHLLSDEFIAQVRRQAAAGAEPVAADLAPAEFGALEGSTTHFVVVDARGNMVSATQSLSLHFGSGIVAPGTGVILNDTMDDFSYANPKAVNFVAAGKRPRSTTSPSVVFRQGKPILAIGLPGAGRIPTAMLQVMVDYLAFHRPLAQAIGDTRLHLPGPVAGQAVANVWETEDSLPDPVADGLRSRGWRVVKKEPAGTGGYFGGFNAIEIQADGTLVGFADPRRSNAAVGY